MSSGTAAPSGSSAPASRSPGITVPRSGGGEARPSTGRSSGAPTSLATPTSAPADAASTGVVAVELPQAETVRHKATTAERATFMAGILVGRPVTAQDGPVAPRSLGGSLDEATCCSPPSWKDRQPG